MTSKELLTQWYDELRSRTREWVAARVVSDNADDGGILDEYVHSAPSAEAAINIFAGEWSSKLPPPLDAITGPSALFDDARITWAADLLGGVEGFEILELGPLEAGHTTMLERAGAASIKAIEANTRSFLKCLIVKELLELRRSTFLCGDFMEYLPTTSEHFDLCVASGVLYHMRDPFEALRLIGTASDRVLLWTHYYDENVVRANPELAARFSTRTSRRSGDFDFLEYRYNYGSTLAWRGFCGGSASFSNWLSRDTILRCLRDSGFDSIDVGFDDPMHQHGPAFAVLAQRGSPT